MPKNVRKSAIAKTVAIKTSNVQDYTQKVINKFLEEILFELKKGNRLEFRGVGVFEVVNRKGKIARNPKTNESVFVPDHKVVKFRPGKLWKREINNHSEGSL